MSPTQTTSTAPTPTTAAPASEQRIRWSGARLGGVVQAAYILAETSR
jgi:hypothetical protein